MDDMEVHAILSSKDGKLFGDIDKHDLGTWSDFSTTLGVTAADMEAGLQKLADQYIGIANTALAAGIVIPSVAGITVTDVDFGFLPGLVTFGASVVPPQFGREVADLLLAFRDFRQVCYEATLHDTEEPVLIQI